ncbi:hypothetical protein GTP20_23820 [Vibrio alginolyticus]|nr:hypothetical protein [Vibrio alginolyticus]
MSLEVLGFIFDNCPEKIEELAEGSKVKNVDVSLRLAGLLGHGDITLEELTEAQVYHYEKSMRPLIENVPCDGVLGIIENDDGEYVDTCNGNGYIDEESLLISYQEDDFKCQICRFDAERM